jgi:hypothetical protein
MDRVGMLDGQRRQGVARLVVGHASLLLVAHDPPLLLEAELDSIDGLFEVTPLHLQTVPAAGVERGLVDHVGQVRPHHAGRASRHDLQLEVRFELHLAGVHLEDVEPPPQVGAIYEHLSIEAPRPQQRSVEHLGPVGGGHDGDAGAGIEAVHLHQQLVERLLALVVGGHGPQAAPGLADGVQLVDEHDAGGPLLGLLEEVADARRPDADEHLHELRRRQREERHVRLTGHRSGQQRLARARGPHQKHPFGDPRADGGKLLGLLEEAHDLHQLGLGLVHAGYVFEGDPLLGTQVVDLGAGPAKAQGAGTSAHATYSDPIQRPQDAERDEPAEQELLPPRGRLDLAHKAHLVGLQLLDQRRLIDVRQAAGGEDLLGPGPLERRGELVATDLDLVQLAGPQLGHQLVVADPPRRLGAKEHGLQDPQHDEGAHEVEAGEGELTLAQRLHRCDAYDEAPRGAMDCGL